MTLLRRSVAVGFKIRVLRSLAIAATTWGAFTTAGCSVDTKGFGGLDAGLGGNGTGATSASGGTSTGGVGSGGSTATGGIPGSGGAHASGGAPGSGGHAGSGGDASGGHAGSGGTEAGGRMGSGGSMGKGGRDGSGGATGTAGHEGTGGKAMATGGAGGRGGAGGAGGKGGESGDTCGQLVDDYTQAMTEARTCTVGATAQCQQTAPATLSYCTGCPLVVVDDATRLTAIRSQWIAAGCAVATLCPAIACVTPSMGICTPTDAGAGGGICQSSGLGPI